MTWQCQLCHVTVGTAFSRIICCYELCCAALILVLRLLVLYNNASGRIVTKCVVTIDTYRNHKKNIG